MKGIGGYFELELPLKESHYHDTPYRLKNGRSALHYIITVTKPALVYVPYYTCDSLLEPLTLNKTPYRFYEVNEDLEPRELPELNAGEYFLYVNYFGIKEEVATRLAEKYGDKLIIDATQAFFMKGNGVSWLFNSCRKFFGVPDGAYLYMPNGFVVPLATAQNVKYIAQHLLKRIDGLTHLITAKNEKYISEHLLKRLDGLTQEGYSFFQKNEELMDCDITGMSLMSERLLSGVDYRYVADRRRENFDILQQELGSVNLLNACYTDSEVPMCYPLLLNKKADRRKLAEQNIFVPVFWNEVPGRLPDGYATEKKITENLLPLPIDHRYTSDDMESIIKSLANKLKRR